MLLKSLVLVFNLVLLCPAYGVDIWIDPNPPTGMDYQTWHNTVMKSCQVWYGTVHYTDKNPQVRFLVGHTGEALGVTTGNRKEFPYVPHPQDNVVVTINHRCPPQWLPYVILHEVGHTIGLHHRRNSIMQHRISFTLTELDCESIRIWRERYRVANGAPSIPSLRVR